MPRRSSPILELCLLGLLAVGAGCHSAPPDAADPEAQFRSTLEAFREDYGFPGGTAAFILPDGTIGVAATGVADREFGTAMTTDSRMLAASIGKTFVAATVLALAGEGQLELDAPVSTWLGERPWFRHLPNHQTITLRHLLTHSSGLPDHVYSPAFARQIAARWHEPGNPFPPESLVEFILDQPALFPAGEGWAYTDTGYILVGLIIESVTGRSYYEEVMRRFLVPLRLGLTTPSDQPILPLLAAGYLDADNPLGLPDKTTVAPGILAWNPVLEFTGGGLVSNPRDLVVWAKALYEGRAMRGENLTELLRSVPVGDDQPGVRYGAGVSIQAQTPLGPVYGHAGHIPGYLSSMRYFPEHGVAVAFQINTDVASPEGLPPLVSEMERRLSEVAVAAARSRE